MDAGAQSSAPDGDHDGLPTVRVAAGVLRDAAGRVLINERPPGRIWAGWWEFPGGKLDAGETAAEALARELHEELGVTVQESSPLLRVRHAYGDRVVDMQVHRVTRWRGQPGSREGQRLAWVLPERLREYRLLPADGPVVTALRLPRQIAVTPPDLGVERARRDAAVLPAGIAVRLRLPGADDGRYAAIAAALRGARPDLPLILDRPVPGLDGVLARMHRRGVPVTPTPGLLAGVSVHGPEELLRAQRDGADFLVLGPLRRTLTHPGAAGLGETAVRAMLAMARVPVVLIGGLGPADLPLALRLGAHGIAGIRAYWGGVPSPDGASESGSGIA